MLTWKAKPNTKDPAYEAKLGLIKLFEIYQFPGVNKLEWRIQTFLPGTHEYFGGFDTHGIAMKRAEAILKEWLVATNLEMKDARLFR